MSPLTKTKGVLGTYMSLIHSPWLHNMFDTDYVILQTFLSLFLGQKCIFFPVCTCRAGWESMFYRLGLLSSKGRVRLL